MSDTLSGWSLWRRQVLAILRLEMRKSFLGKRAFPLYLLASLPVLAMVGFAIMPMEWKESAQIAWAGQVFGGVYQFILRGIVFFGCAWMFTNLFRGEVLDRSLHYYLLAPVKRPVLVASKFLSGLVAAIVLFGGTTVVCYLLLFPPYGWPATSDYLFNGPGLGHLFGYFGVTVLACLGYGAIFLLIGAIFKNPILPAGGMLLWEGANLFLPPFLKKLSVIHYLRALIPIKPSAGPFAVLSEPPHAIVSILGLLALAAVTMALASLRVSRMEVRYGED